MIRYREKDFRTPFAKMQFIDAEENVDWALLAKHSNTDIMAVGIKAVYEQAIRNKRPPQELTENEQDYTLGNGAKVKAKTINDYIKSHGVYTYLTGLKMAEEFSEANPSLKEFGAEYAATPHPQPGEINLTVFMRSYPLETSLVFFQMRYAGELNNPFVSNALFSEVQSTLNLAGMGTGPHRPGLSEEDAVEIIQKVWPSLDNTLTNKTIPTARVNRDGGPQGGTIP